jgi:hypothetical protein
MRMYAYRPGPPGYILAEVALTEEQWAEVSSGAMDRYLIDGLSAFAGAASRVEVLSRDELLAVSTRRRALLAWEADEDSAFEHGEAKERRRWAEGEVREHAACGCPEALELVAQGMASEAVRSFVAEHLCEGEPFEAWYRQNGLKVGLDLTFRKPGTSPSQHPLCRDRTHQHGQRTPVQFCGTGGNARERLDVVVTWSDVVERPHERGALPHTEELCGRAARGRDPPFFVRTCAVQPEGHQAFLPGGMEAELEHEVDHDV